MYVHVCLRCPTSSFTPVSSHATCSSPRQFVGGVRLNRAGKLEARGDENAATVAAAAALLPDLDTFTAAHMPRVVEVRPACWRVGLRGSGVGGWVSRREWG